MYEYEIDVQSQERLSGELAEGRAEIGRNSLHKNNSDLCQAHCISFESSEMISPIRGFP